MKKTLIVLVTIFFALLVLGCKSTSGSAKPMKVSKKVKQPELIDHKNLKWGKTPPEWVSLERNEIEAMDTYKEKYAFVFESEKSKDLDGAKLWLENFAAPRELSRMISQRVKDVAASAASGTTDGIEKYTKEIVKTVSAAELNGLKKEGDYWILQRYFDPNGEVEGDFYSVLAFYSIPRKTLDGIIATAIKNADAPKNQNEQKVRAAVNRALREEF